MGFELIFTSVPKGLKPGSRGFASVAFTEGMPSNYVQICESLSGYVHIFGPQESDYIKNPIAFSHLVTSVGGRPFSILSRVASYGTDYTGRTNKLAHHIMLGPDERTVQGPAVLMNGKGLFQEEWSEQPHFLQTNRIVLPNGDIDSLRATTWERMTGDAGNAGRLAQAFLDAPSKPSFIIFNPGMNIMPLIAEAQALLPIPRRWDLSFSTYFTSIPVGMDCAWRCCLPDSDALKVARRTQGTLVVDLTTRQITGPLSTTTTLIEVARTGTQVKPAAQITLNTDVPRKISPVAKPIANVEASRAQPASSAKQIRVNYVEALRPRPPKKDVPKRKGWVIAAMAGSIVVTLLIIGTYVKRDNAQLTGEVGIKSVNTNTPLSSSYPTNSLTADQPSQDVKQPIAAVPSDAKPVNTNTPQSSSCLTNIPNNEKTLNDSKQPNADEHRNQRKDEISESGNAKTISTPPQLVALPPGNKYIPLTEDPVFYSTDGEIIEHDLLQGVADGWSFKNAHDVKDTLAKKLMTPPRLGDFSSKVQIVELPKTNTVYIVNELTVSLNSLDKSTYSVCMQNTSVADKLMAFFISKEHQSKLQVTGAKKGSGKYVLFTLSSIPTGNVHRIDVTLKDEAQRKQWIENEVKLEDALADYSKQIAKFDNDDAALSDWAKKIASCATQVREARNSKDAKNVRKEKIEKANDSLKREVEDAVKFHNSIKDAPSIAYKDMASDLDKFLNKVIPRCQEDLQREKQRKEILLSRDKKSLEKLKKVPVNIIITLNDIPIINASTP